MFEAFLSQTSRFLWRVFSSFSRSFSAGLASELISLTAISSVMGEQMDSFCSGLNHEKCWKEFCLNNFKQCLRIFDGWCWKLNFKKKKKIYIYIYIYLFIQNTERTLTNHENNETVTVRHHCFLYGTKHRPWFHCLQARATPATPAHRPNGLPGWFWMEDSVSSGFLIHSFYWKNEFKKTKSDQKGVDCGIRPWFLTANKVVLYMSMEFQDPLPSLVRSEAYSPSISKPNRWRSWFTDSKLARNAAMVNTSPASTNLTAKCRPENPKWYRRVEPQHDKELLVHQQWVQIKPANWIQLAHFTMRNWSFIPIYRTNWFYVCLKINWDMQSLTKWLFLESSSNGLRTSQIRGRKKKIRFKKDQYK